MGQKLRVGLLGYGKAGLAVANVLSSDPRYDLRWIVRRNAHAGAQVHPDTDIPILTLADTSFDAIFEQRPVDALVDFSSRECLREYGKAIHKRRITLISAISAYTDDDLDYARSLGTDIRILCSPNITLGINFLIAAAKLLHRIAPFADVEIVEQHFREKPEVSGTARKIAETLEVNDERITSLRLGGIIGHHEVIFGFPYQTVRLTHESIRREAFGTGAAFALEQLQKLPPGFYTFDALLLHILQQELARQ